MKRKWRQYVGIRSALIVTVGVMMVAGMNLLHDRSKLKQANRRYIADITTKDSLIADLNQQLSRKASELQRLETQLTRFRTIALEEHTGPEQEVLKKLADAIQELENPLERLIASATSHVEVTIGSDEQVSTVYVAAGGYLAFVKDRQTVLVTAGTQSQARQTGGGEVIYSGDFSIAPGPSTVGATVEALQTSDLIQIAFRKIPANSQVLRGKAAVVINGDTRFEFEIPPQQMQNDMILIRDMTHGGSWGSVPTETLP